MGRGKKLTTEMVAWYATLVGTGETRIHAANDTIARFGVNVGVKHLMRQAIEAGSVQRANTKTKYTLSMVSDFEGLLSCRVRPLTAAEIVRDKYRISALPVTIMQAILERADRSRMDPRWAWISEHMEAA